MQLTQYKNQFYKACIKKLQKKNKPYTWRNEITSRGRYKKKHAGKRIFLLTTTVVVQVHGMSQRKEEQ